MLHGFLLANRAILAERCRAQVAARLLPKAAAPGSQFQPECGIPLFLDLLIRTLEVERDADTVRSLEISGPSGGEIVDLSEIGLAATLYGRELARQGFSVNHVVHSFGDVCQAISSLAFEEGVGIEVQEFRTLNRCLDNAIAAAVTAFAAHHGTSSEATMRASNERLGSLAHELRNLVHTAMLATTAIKTGNVGISGATGAVLERSLIGLRGLIDRSLADVRATVGMPARFELMSLAALIAEFRLSSSLEAQGRDCRFSVSEVDNSLVIDADRDLLCSAVENLIQNAFKFTQPGTEVSLSAYASGDRVLIEISDKGAGLPPAVQAAIFAPFSQCGVDRSGMGLGLSIAKRGVEANHGTLSVRSAPGAGSTFTISLPRHHALP